MARHDVVIARAVAIVGVRVAADDGEFVGDRRAIPTMLGEDHAGGFRGDRGERTTNLQRGLGFGVPHILLGWAPFEEDKDAALGLRRARRGGGVLGGEQARQRQAAEETGGTEPQHLPPRPTIAGGPGGTSERDVEHRQEPRLTYRPDREAPIAKTVAATRGTGKSLNEQKLFRVEHRPQHVFHSRATILPGGGKRFAE